MNFKVAAHWRMFTGREKFSKLIIAILCFSACKLVPNQRHQKLPVYIALGIYRRQKLLWIVGRLGTVRPTVHVHGWQAPVVSSPHTYQHCEQSAKLGVLQA